jgi:N-acetyl-alpha-D-glucosaminyl L-malate synthase BshA
MHGTDTTLVGSDPVFLPLTRLAIERSDALTVPSDFLARATRERFGLAPEIEIDVIPNFVDEERYAPAAERSSLAALFPRLAAAFADERTRPRVLVHNSNFRPVKRVTDAVAVLAAVRRHAPAVLVLIGDGPERTRVEAAAHAAGVADAVCFLGKQLDFVEVLQASDIFLMPSASESFGLAALEAMSCGVPVVASDVGGLPEVVGDGDAGLLCAVGDVEAMAAAALALLGDEARRARMGERARARVLERYRRAPIVARYEDCYRRLLV